jgi:nuclear GTP-binding protein
VAPVARVEPNRKWFGNTRVISQDALESFRGAVEAQASDPTRFLMKRNKLPMSLIESHRDKVNGVVQHAAKIAVEAQPFADVFGSKAQYVISLTSKPQYINITRRKRPKLDFSSIEDLQARTDTMHDTYLERLEQSKLLSGTSGDADADEQERNPDGDFAAAREFIFLKGTSKRIWVGCPLSFVEAVLISCQNELYKVIDSSDVILHVLGWLLCSFARRRC